MADYTRLMLEYGLLSLFIIDLRRWVETHNPTRFPNSSSPSRPALSLGFQSRDFPGYRARRTPETSPRRSDWVFAFCPTYAPRRQSSVSSGDSHKERKCGRARALSPADTNEDGAEHTRIQVLCKKQQRQLSVPVYDGALRSPIGCHRTYSKSLPLVRDDIRTMAGHLFPIPQAAAIPVVPDR